MTTQAVPLGDAPKEALPAVAAEDVVIYQNAEEVPGKYKTLAVVNASGPLVATSKKELYRALQEKAGQLGANGIILQEKSSPGANSPIEVGREATAIFVYPKRKGQDRKEQDKKEETKEPWALVRPAEAGLL